MNRFAATLAACVLSLALALTWNHAPAEPSRDAALSAAPVAAVPDGPPLDAGVVPTHEPLDLTAADAVVWRTTEAAVIDTTTFPQQVRDGGPPLGPQRLVKDHLPVHGGKPGIVPVPASDLPIGRLLDAPRARPAAQFPGITQTGWVPPDPSLGVGPTHVVETVNQSVAFYTRAGTQEFEAILGSQGNPGFLEDVGAQTFAFDPKCFYDPYAERFLVLALEVYDSGSPSGTAFITLAVSDDSNPNGTWYKYRTDAVINVSGTNFWWDYPGLGFDEDAYYVTGNLFGFGGGWAGVGYRVFDKAPLLTGAPATYATLRDGGSASIQIAQHFGTAPAAYFVGVANTSAIRVQAIANPLTSPTLSTQDVAVPGFSGPSEPPAPGGNTVSVVDLRMLNACWRNNQLYLCHTVFENGRNQARWYQVDTGNWPASGGVSLVQSGNIDVPGLHTWFPAIYANASDQVAMVIGSSSESERIAVQVTGRFPGDPAGFMGAPTELIQASVNGGGRWGDYYDIAIDPLDDETFWVVGEYPAAFGWSTWLGSFAISGAGQPVAVGDDGGAAAQGLPRLIDVLANDFHRAGLPVAIDSFDATSAGGGSIALVPGSGGGNDLLEYTSGASFTGTDSFTYTISDPNGVTASATVAVEVFDNFRAPDNPAATVQGLNADYYEVSGIGTLPDFGTLTPYDTTAVARLNFSSTNGNFANSGRADNVGAVYTGFVDVPELDIYTFFTESDDGSRLLIGDTVVVDNDGLHGMQERSGQIALQPGLHALRVEFFEAGGGAGLIASIQGGGIDKVAITRPRLQRLGCAADFDADGAVTLNDLAIVLANFGDTGATPADGDANGDGLVDLSDLAEVLAQFGLQCS